MKKKNLHSFGVNSHKCKVNISLLRQYKMILLEPCLDFNKVQQMKISCLFAFFLMYLKPSQLIFSHFLSHIKIMFSP